MYDDSVQMMGRDTMATENILMPQLGESVTEGTISKWLVSVGDHVKKYDPIAEVMTDKVNAEVPVSFTGKISQLTAEEGDTIEVGECIGYMEVEDSLTSEATQASSDSIEGDSSSDQRASSEGAHDTGEQSMKKRYSPAVLNLAQAHDISLDDIEGSGKSGRITRKDVQAVIDAGGQQQPQPSQSTTEANTPVQSFTEDVDIPVSGVRKAIASNLTQSKQEVPHAWTMVEVDVTDLVQYRQSIKDGFKQSEGHSLTFLPFL